MDPVPTTPMMMSPTSEEMSVICRFSSRDLLRRDSIGARRSRKLQHVPRQVLLMRHACHFDARMGLQKEIPAGPDDLIAAQQNKHTHTSANLQNWQVPCEFVPRASSYSAYSSLARASETATAVSEQSVSREGRVSAHGTCTAGAHDTRDRYLSSTPTKRKDLYTTDQQCTEL